MPTREVAAGVGDGSEERAWTGEDEGLRGLLAAGDRDVFSGFISSGIKGSVKKRVPGDFTGVIWKETEKLRI